MSGTAILDGDDRNYGQILLRTLWLDLIGLVVAFQTIRLGYAYADYQITSLAVAVILLATGLFLLGVNANLLAATAISPLSPIRRRMAAIVKPNALAAGVMSRIRNEWEVSEIRTSKRLSPHLDQFVGPNDSAVTYVEFADGSGVACEINRNRMPTITVYPAHGSHARIKGAAGQHVAAAIRREQISRLAVLLGLSAGATADEVSEAAAERCSGSFPNAQGFDNAMDDRNYALEIEGTGIVLTARYGGITLGDVVAEAPGIGMVRLTRSIVMKTMKDRSKAQIARAFGVSAASTTRTPVLANPRADMIASIATRALEYKPDLQDALGTPLMPLVKEHLPELVEKYQRAIRTARPAERPLVEADFQKGLDIVSKAVDEGLEGIRAEDRRNLRIELRFLESRHATSELENLS